MAHRSHWECPKCSEFFRSPRVLEEHLNRFHRQEVCKRQTPAIITLSKRPAQFIQPSECHFCDEEWASGGSSTPLPDGALVVDIDQFRKHVGHHLQQIALFSLPRPSQEQGAGSKEVGDDPNQDEVPGRYKWVREDSGRGWTSITSRRATFIAFSAFLALYNENRSHIPTTRTMSDVNPERVPVKFKVLNEDWQVIYNSEVPRALEVHLLYTLQSLTASNLRFSNSGKLLAVASFGEIHIFNTTMGSSSPVAVLQSSTPEDDQRYDAVAFNPDDQYLASGQTDGTVTVGSVTFYICFATPLTLVEQVWDVMTSTAVDILRDHTDTVLSLCWSLDSRVVASGSADKTVKLWEIETRTCERTLTSDAGVHSLAISDDSMILAGGCDDGRIRLWYRHSGSLIALLDGLDHYAGTSTVWAVNFMQGTVGLLTAGSDHIPGNDQPIKLWNLKTTPPSCIRSFLGQKVRERFSISF